MDNEQKTIVKQLNPIATLLLTHNNPEARDCACAILDFTILAYYISHDNKTLIYMEHVLYRLNKTTMVFEKLCLINT